MGRRSQPLGATNTAGSGRLPSPETADPWVWNSLSTAGQSGWRHRAVSDSFAEPDDFIPETEQPPDEDA